MSPRAKRRHRRHRMHAEQQSKQQKQITDQLAGLGGVALSQPIFFVLSDEQEMTVSRSMPGILEGHMDDLSWTAFCDKLDEALLPLTKVKKLMKRWCMYPLVVFVPLVIIGLMTSGIIASRSIRDLTSADVVRTMLPVMFLIAFLGLIVWAIGMANYSSRIKASVNKKLEKICYETSTSYPGVSFKVYIELHYMPVIVANDDPCVPEEAEIKESESTDDSTVSIGSQSTPPTSAPTYLTPADIVEAKKWKTAIDESTDKMYYFNEETREVTWEHPLMEMGKADVENEEDKTREKDRLGDDENRNEAVASPEENV